MKQILPLVALLFALNACTSTDRPLDIPDTVNVSKTKEHQQIPGTRIFMVIPKGYTVSGTTVRKADGTEILIMDSQGRALDKEKDLAAIPKETRDIKTFFQKNFMLNGYQANIRYGKTKKENEEKIYLIAGDDNFVMAVLCTIPDNNVVDREEVISVLKTAIVDKSVQLDYAALRNYSLDFSQSVFKFNRNTATVFCYTPEGKGDITYNVVSTVGPLPAMPRVQDMKDAARELARRIGEQKVVKKMEEKVVNIREKPAYEITMKVEQNGRSQNVYLLMLGNATSTVYYVGYINEDQPALWKECKQLAQTLQLK